MLVIDKEKEKNKEEKFENIKDLRSKNFVSDNSPDLKKKFFGLHKTKEVKDYIQEINKQHERTLKTYKERIDELVTSNEMLTKEKEEAFGKAGKTEEINEKLKEKIEILKMENDDYAKKTEILNEKLSNFEKLDNVEERETNLRLSKENEHLQEELNALAKMIKDTSGENAQLKSELHSLKDDFGKKCEENAGLEEEIAFSNSLIRKIKTNNNTEKNEFSQSQLFLLEKNKKMLQSALSDLEKMSDSMQDFKNRQLEE